MNIKIKFEKKDLWIGVFWDIKEFKQIVTNYGLYGRDKKSLFIYICLIPCFPIVIEKEIK